MIRTFSKRLACAPLATSAVLLAASLSADPATAGSIACANPCQLDTELLPYQLDYTITPSGLTYRWDFRAVPETGSEPITVRLSPPSQLDGVGYTFGGDLVMLPVNLIWRELVTPTLTSYFIKTPADFDRCSQGGPADELCSATYTLWGNGTFLYGQTDYSGPFTLYFSESVVPEPATWAMMIAGFGLVGAATRRSRSLAAL